jgi:sugar phosphate isomerase/epimerase
MRRLRPANRTPKRQTRDSPNKNSGGSLRIDIETKTERSNRMIDKQTRRNILQLAGVGAVMAGLRPAIGAEHTDTNPNKAKFNLGMASYTFRKSNLEQTIAMTRRLGLKYICLKDFHLPLKSSKEEIEKAAAKVKDSGLVLYACGVIYMKTEADVQQAFEYAKQAGINMMVGVPNPELLGLVEKKVAEYDIKVAVHNHGPGDQLYPTPESVYEKIKGLDKRIGLCIDIGHTQRSGIDPSEPAEKFADRLMDVHIKDVNAATADGTTVEIGRGVIDIVKFLKTLVAINFSGVTAFEYEKDENDPLAGVAESIGYTKGVLASV